MVSKQASLILFCNFYPCTAPPVGIVEMSALGWSLGDVVGQTWTIPSLGEVWGADTTKGNGNCFNPSAPAGSVGWLLWMVAVMSSSHLLMDIRAGDLSVDPLKWTEKSVHGKVSFSSCLTLTTTSGKALHCNSLTVALYSKHLVLQVKNYFLGFVLKLSFI